MKLHRLLLSLFILGLPQSGWTQDVAHDAKPNILIILADDLHWRDLGATGNPDVYSPNIDQLARDGMQLNGLFASSAVCSPLRHALYTGLYPIRSGAYPNHTMVTPETRSVFHHLKDLGYRVGLLGKTHISPAVAFPFETISTKYIVNNDTAAFFSRDPEQPWFMVFAAHEPHFPWRSGPRDRYDADKLTLPSWLHDNQVTRNATADYYAEVSALDEHVGKLLKLIEQAGQESRTMVWFFSEQGSQLPYGGKWSLYDNGIRVAGFVRWPDHIQPGSSSDVMLQYIDVVPTLIEIAGGNPQESDTGRAGASDGKRGFDGRSFLPALNGNGDVHRRYVFAQHTTVGVYGYREPYPSRAVRDDRYKLIRNLAFQNEFWINGIHDNPVYKSWQEDAKKDPKLARRVELLSHRPAVELYDLKNDPFEQNNLAGQADYKKIESRLDKALTSWMQQQGDQGMATELKAKSHQPPSLKKELEEKQKKGFL